MKLRVLTTTVTGIFLTSLVLGQNQEKYAELVEKAWSLYESKNYKQSAETYKAAFDQLDGKAYPDDRYNAACSYALANDKENSFHHLFYLAEHPKIAYNNVSHISTDTDLNLLHSDGRWSQLIEIVKANKQAYEKDLDKPLVAELDTIYQLDQNYRRQISKIEEKYGRASEEMKSHWKLIHETDSINLTKVKKILDTRGWLGPNVIGEQGNMTLFLVIQHADLETQLTYLPMMREAVKLGNARASRLALLEDRVALRQGKRQIYGSQIGWDPETEENYVLPLIEPETVNVRRSEVGLDPIEVYVGNYGMKWDVEKHKERIRKMKSVEEE